MGIHLREKIHSAELCGPWPDVATARLFLSTLIGLDPGAKTQPVVIISEWSEVARWLIEQGVGPLAFSRCLDTYPELADHLKIDNYTAVAQSGLHYDSLAQIETAFESAGVPIALLKGAALAQTAYDDVALRTMSDIDIWVRDQDMPQAVELMQKVGFVAYKGKDERPLPLQILSRGEIQFYGEHWGMVELHWSPFPGWWLKRTAVVDDTAVWNRVEPIIPGGNSYQLAAEDMVIQVAVHLVVSGQFSVAAIRGLIDIALTAKTRPVDWAVVAERAKSWRVSTAVWLVLHQLDQLIGTPGLEPALERLRPSRLRQRLLQKFVSPESLLASMDLRNSRSRYLLLILLIDRIRDMIYLIFRTLWPEKEWMQARYQGRKNRGHHLWQVVRYGRI